MVVTCSIRNADVPSEVQNSQTIEMSLIVWRSMHTVNTRLYEPTCKRSKSVTGINRNSAILRTNPFPLTLRVEDLKRSNGLSEE